MKVAIIPARGGSKRIPRKNVKLFCGRPMIAWSIEAAIESGSFDHIVVSTDDEEIAEVAEKYGAQVPFRRPQELAHDLAATRPVVNHAINEVCARYGRPDAVCCIYATAPFLRGIDLHAAYAMLVEHALEFVFSAGIYSYPIQRAFRMSKSGVGERLYPEHRFTRSQDLEPIYHDAGQFYWGRPSSFLENKDSIESRSRPYVIPSYRVQDIDTLEDWRRAEVMASYLIDIQSTE